MGFLDFLLNRGIRGFRISPQHGLENTDAILLIYTIFSNLPYNPFPLLPNGPPSFPKL